MKNSNIIALFLLMLSLTLTVSCHKTVSTGTPPTLTISAPTVDDSFAGGQVITIKGETSDAENLHALTIKITDDKTGAVLFSNEPVVHDLKTYSFNVTWTAKISDWTNATVTVIAQNHNELLTTQTVKIKIWL